MNNLTRISFMTIAGGAVTPFLAGTSSFSYTRDTGSVTLCEGVTVTSLGNGNFIFASDSITTPIQISGSIGSKSKSFNINSENGSGSYVAVTITKRHNQLVVEGTLSETIGVG
jgi:VCBS repeat-containing protein